MALDSVERDMQIGPLTLRLGTCEIARDGVAEAIEPKVFRVLCLLVRERGSLTSRQMLIDQCWSGRVVSDDAVNRVMSRIRQIGASTGAFQVLTVRKVGYRLRALMADTPSLAADAPVTEAALPQARADADVVAPQTPGAPFAWRTAAGFAVAVVAAMAVGGGVVAWRHHRTKPAQAPSAVSLSVASLANSNPQDKALAADLTSGIRAAASNLKGIRLIDPVAGGAPARSELVLDGEVDHQGKEPTVRLVLHDGRTGSRIWGATIDGLATGEPTLTERVVSAPVRYLSIWLGERLSGEPTAREPQTPEVSRLVADARHLVDAADEARSTRDMTGAKQRYDAAEKQIDQALAIDSRSAAALMVRYKIESGPAYPRLGEPIPAFKKRMQDAEQDLAQALAADPNDPDVLVAAAAQLRGAMQWDDSSKLLERAVAIDPNSASAATWYAYELSRLNRCDEALRYGRIAVGLKPDLVWQQLVVPRVMLCAGKASESLAIERSLLAKDPADIFLLRDPYLTLLAQHSSVGLRDLAAYVRTQLWRGQPPAKVAEMLSRIEAAADAIDGRPSRFVGLVDADAANSDKNLAQEQSVFAKTEGDNNFVLALEYAAAGAVDQAIDRLQTALEGGSVYLPWTLPYSALEFPEPVRKNPRYQALWRSTPAVAHLIDLRRQASEAAIALAVRTAKAKANPRP